MLCNYGIDLFIFVAKHLFFLVLVIAIYTEFICY